MELKDLPKPISREDIYKYAICNGKIENLPKPLRRQDFYLMALIDGKTENLPQPISRLDIIMYHCIMGIMENLPKPISRSDYYWTAICTGLKQNIPTPVSRSDYYDYYLALYSAFREWLEYKGETIQASCRREAYIRDLKLEGKTYKNLFNKEKAIYSKAGAGLDFLWDDNKEILTNTSSSNVIYPRIALSNNCLKPNTVYTIQLYYDNTNSGTTVNAGFVVSFTNDCYWNVPGNVGQVEGSSKAETLKVTFNTGNNDLTKFKIGGRTINAGNNYKVTVKDIIILEGDYSDKDINFVEGIESCGSKESKINLDVNNNVIEIPIELKAVRDSIDSIEKINNVWSYVKRVEKLILDENTDFELGTVATNTVMFKFTNPVNTKNFSNLICSHFNFYSSGNTSGDVEMIHCGSTGKSLIKISKSKLVTQDVARFKAWLKDNPVTVYYQLAEPVVTPLPVEFQDKLDSLQVTKGSNTITTNNDVKANIECNLPV